HPSWSAHARGDEMYGRVGSLAEVPEGELRSFDLPVLRVAIAHVENELFAFGDECTHEGCSLAEGTLGDQEDTVVCPCHQSEFDLATGEPVGGPAVDPGPGGAPAPRASSPWGRASPSGARRSIRCRCTPSE